MANLYRFCHCHSEKDEPKRVRLAQFNSRHRLFFHHSDACLHCQRIGDDRETSSTPAKLSNNEFTSHRFLSTALPRNDHALFRSGSYGRPLKLNSGSVFGGSVANVGDEKFTRSVKETEPTEPRWCHSTSFTKLYQRASKYKQIRSQTVNENKVKLARCTGKICVFM